MARLIFRSAAILGAAAALLGCASGNTQSDVVKVDGDPATLARIRVFGNNGFGVVFYRNKSCVPKDREGGVRASGSMGQSFKAFVRADQNESIGMPPSQRSAQARDGILAKEFFKEYEVKGGEPLTVTMGFTGTPRPPAVNGVGWLNGPESCSIPGGTFMPEAGKDYDVYLDIRRSQGICLATVEAINAAGESVLAQVQSAAGCM
jgi:hypothetical protein